MGCGVGHRCNSDPALLWLWCRPAATALIQPLAWEPPYVEGAALKNQTKDFKKSLAHMGVKIRRPYFRKCNLYVPLTII